jgi:outer membrane protein assembly factor BamE (lipoprotein component of BamABCDE complex)
MARLSLVAAGLVAALTLSACISPARDFHGYIADEIQPIDIKPGEDTRSTVLAQLGSPSTEGLFDTNTWFYYSDIQERFAFYRPKVVDRSIVAIRFSEDDAVDEVVKYDVTAGEIVSYASRETPTRGRELGFWEQIFGTVGAVRLPNSDEVTPGNPTGRRQ